MTTETTKTKCLIIGSGCAGLTAGIYLGRAGLKPIVVSGDQTGGQLTTTSMIENYPGYSSIDGAELMQKMQDQMVEYGGELCTDTIVNIDVSKRPFKCNGRFNDFLADTVVIATGSTPKSLGCKGEEEFRGRGVSTCAICDGFFFRKKIVFVVGGGNVALEDSLYLSKIVDAVYLVHRRDSFRGEKILQEKVLSTGNIVILWDSVIESIIGDNVVTGVNVSTKGVLKTYPTSGVFIAIGHVPNTKLFLGSGLAYDDEGYIIGNETVTNIEGVFAAGDCVDKVYRQAVTAAGTGCAAALRVERFLS